ncbi:hypothetical protein EI555_006179 [Monodon monoceros]|uniref:PPM-type phosphatase domain-containing protein n=1 Tax=Monodon monoceros TaxID=40151 RepID=A0A4U1EQT4_MONMO|nr:hypothetical protein EI555_006179 [Monodon monoceros]
MKTNDLAAAPGDALGMASGPPQQNSQKAEENPSLLDALLRDFPAPLGPESPLPWKVRAGALGRHLLPAWLLRTNLSELRKLPEQVEEDRDEEEEAPVNLLDAAGLVRSLFDQLWEVCSQWQKQVPVAVWVPQRQWLVSVHAIRNARLRMEDQHVCLPAFNLLFGLSDSVDGAYFAVFDGHGGVDAAGYASVHMHAVAAHQPEMPTDPAGALRAAFRCTDDILSTERPGSTLGLPKPGDK